MIDPTNTEPIPVHTPHPRRILSAIAIIVLVGVAILFVLKETQDSEVPVIPPPSANSGTSIFSSELQSQLTEIERRIAEGEISRGEGERLMEEAFRKNLPENPAN